MHLLDIVDIFSSHDYEVIIRATQAPKDAYEKAKEYGEIAQLARAHGSYPWCRGFESPSRYLTKGLKIQFYWVFGLFLL